MQKTEQQKHTLQRNVMQWALSIKYPCFTLKDPLFLLEL